jgi:hypothetical protein
VQLTPQLFFTAPFIPSAPGVNTSSAPKALSRFLRSILIVSGIVRISLYPLAAATQASPIPVFPLVGMSNKEIAVKLEITVNTVKGYIKNIYEKFGVNRRIQAITRAKKLGILKKN